MYVLLLRFAQYLQQSHNQNPCLFSALIKIAQRHFPSALPNEPVQPGKREKTQRQQNGWLWQKKKKKDCSAAAPLASPRSSLLIRRSGSGASMSVWQAN